MIRRWCVSVWESWKETQNQIGELAKQELDIR